jgi:hypothetical protein
MPRRALCISFSDLPPRPHPLSESELSRVFGGCVGDYERCNEDCDCCAGYFCKRQVWYDQCRASDSWIWERP